ncbi:MAG: glycoside hydrolase family 97 catalytic domain-containing protein [Chitinophagaceae bacterium]|nr:glycoside hydrolase family 97 catalytic domain-containing protein [Chitinophagaceae bacterium]
MRTLFTICARKAFFPAFLFSFVAVQSQKTMQVGSPDKKLQVDCKVTADGKLSYTVTYRGAVVLQPSRLGVIRNDGDFASGITFLSASAMQPVKDNYTMVNAKKSRITYIANKRVLRLKNSSGQKMNIIFQVSNDGVAFRYEFPERSVDVRTIHEELTTYHFDKAAKAWLQPMSVAKSGWEHSNPSYEEHYKQDIRVGTASAAGWVYPALFKVNDTWLLVSETFLDSSFCGTRLVNDSASNEYKVGFPDPREVFTGRGLLPNSSLPWFSPWRIITIGNLKTIAESTLGTDLARPAITMNTSFVRPGKASWSWINSKDDFITYDEQKKYIDYAADMRWQYCLVDVNWDTKIGYDKIKELAGYAATKNVGLILWYNSAGDWNTTPYHPKSMLLTHEQREKEFSRLYSMGIKGVKIDFFGGDGQSMIKYYHDILIDAAKHKLLVNFHGATLPRGWQRTYPHLVTTEAIRGFEMVTFGQKDADEEASHCTMLPFTRNAFDPMDFTPVNLYKIPTRVQRRTTSAFELALSVLFLSGIQHFAESPEGMSHVPEYAKDFLRSLPAHWDNARFLDGYPGKYVVIARKSGERWYIAGINGQNTSLAIQLSLSSFQKSNATLITDGTEGAMFSRQNFAVKTAAQKMINMQPRGGFVMVLE